MPKPRFLGVLLCYNDGDILADAITDLLSHNHDVIVWNHGSTDETKSILGRFRHDLREVTDIGRAVEFYDIYPLMSKHLMENYVHQYDWISWPDQDEILEGPDRSQSYDAFLVEAVESPHNWIQFNDFIYWYTEHDDDRVESPCQRIRHYSLACLGPMKIRSWRASATNFRWFNHNPAHGTEYPKRFNLRHYPMRSERQMRRRISVDRAGIQRGPVNYHYEHMKTALESLTVSCRNLHFDDGQAELNQDEIFDWKSIYGSGPKLPASVVASYMLSTSKWDISSRVLNSLRTVLTGGGVPRHVSDRVRQWLNLLEKGPLPATIVIMRASGLEIVSEEEAEAWERGQRGTKGAINGSSAPKDTVCNGVAIRLSADYATRSLKVFLNDTTEMGPEALIVLGAFDGDEASQVSEFRDRVAEFKDVRAGRYVLAIDPRGAQVRMAGPPGGPGMSVNVSL